MSNGNGAGVAGGRSRLHLLDLGSCQTIRSASAATSNAMTLSGLGNVLVALFNGQRHLPHREHKITQVLRECLGSLTCQAALVAHIANTSAYSETLSTVQMASRVHRMRRRRVKVAFKFFYFFYYIKKLINFTIAVQWRIGWIRIGREQ